jgi:type VI protein secretion system component VasA
VELEVTTYTVALVQIHLTAELWQLTSSTEKTTTTHWPEVAATTPSMAVLAMTT